MILGFILFLLFFATLTYTRFSFGISVMLLLLPTYLIRFSLGPLPTTLFEILFLTVCFIWLARFGRQSLARVIETKHTWGPQHYFLISAIVLFLTGATLSVFTAVDMRAALGEWKAFYIEPCIFFIILTASLQQYKKNRRAPGAVSPNHILVPLLLCGLATSILAIFQHFTGWMVPHAFWANGDSYRVTAWYGFPNGVGLFLAPLVPVAIYIFLDTIKSMRTRPHQWHTSMMLFLSSISLVTLPLAVLYAKSTGGLVGMIGGIGLLLFWYKKTRWPTALLAVIGMLAIFLLPQLQPIHTELSFQDRSGHIRVAIYSETIALLRDHPIRGAGLASYDERIAPYHKLVNNERIEIFHHPHNLFLTMWVNIGFLGLIGFIGIITCVMWGQVRQLANKHTWQTLSFFMFASFVTLLITGLVDSPYIKNDLAILFFTILTLALPRHSATSHPMNLEKNISVQ